MADKESNVTQASPENFNDEGARTIKEFRILELVQVVPETAIDKALDDPIKDVVFEPINSAELHKLDKYGHDEASNHLLTTLFLRLTGDPTSIQDYNRYRKEEEDNTSLQKRARSTRQERADSDQKLEIAQHQAMPYVDMLVSVSQQRDAYRLIYDNSNSASLGIIITDIYDKTEHLNHPVLTYVRNRDNAKVLREVGVESERLLRFMLAYRPDASQAIDT